MEIKPSLIVPAENCLLQCFQAKAGDKVAIVANHREQPIAEALYQVALNHGCQPSILYYPAGKINGEEPPEVVFHAMNNADIAFAVTTKSISHTKIRKQVSANKHTRIASLPGITAESFIRGMSADYILIKELCNKVFNKLNPGKDLHITTPSGTDLRIDISNPAIVSNGDLSEPGAWGNLPDGESELAPVTANGVMVADTCGSLITEPTKIYIKDGWIIEVEDNEPGRRFKKLLQECEAKDGNKNSNFMAEFAIGTNPTAQICGVVLEDEKVLGTAHIAFGNNTSYPGGNNYSTLHLDMILLKPTITIDGELIQKDGALLV